MKRLIFSALVLVSVITLSFAAGIDGLWAGKYEGIYDVTLNLKVNGKQLTGTITVADNNPISENPGESEYSAFIGAQMGENAILDGTITGNDFSFKTDFNGTQIPYKGKIEADKIIFSAMFKGEEVKTTLRRPATK